MISSRKFWGGLGISAIFIGLFVATVDLGRMVNALAGASYLYLVPAVLVNLISVLFRTLRWQVLLRHMRIIKVRRLFPIVAVGYMANNLLPMRLGELVRSYYVGEREEISKTSALATILVERVLDALTLLFFIAATAVFVPLTGLAEAFGERTGVPWPLLVSALSAPFVITFGVLLLFAFYPAAARASATTLAGPLPQRIEAPIRDLVDLFLSGLTPLRSPRTLAVLFLLSVPIWLFEASLFFLVGFSFGLDQAYDNLGEMAVGSVLVTAISNIGSSVPAAPGGIGLFELVARETVVLLPIAEIDRAVAGAFATVVHLTLLLPMIVLGQVFLWAGHLSLRKLSQAGSAERTARAERSEEVPPRIKSPAPLEGDEPNP